MDLKKYLKLLFCTHIYLEFKKYILAISYYYNDSAAVLICNRRVISAVK